MTSVIQINGQAVRSLAASLLCVISVGERQVEIIRKVLFQLNGFSAYHLFESVRRAGLFTKARSSRYHLE